MSSIPSQLSWLPVIPVGVKQVQVEPLVLGLEKLLADPHSIWPCSETPTDTKVGTQADNSVYRLFSLASHSTRQTPCAVCITTGLNRCQSFWCILQIGNKISSAAIQTNYALIQHVLHQRAWGCFSLSHPQWEINGNNSVSKY